MAVTRNRIGHRCRPPQRHHLVPCGQVATPGRYIMSSDLNPYQAEAAIPDSTTCPGGQCVLRFPTVPVGKRLVIESESAQLGPVADALVLEGSGVAYFVRKADPNIGVSASQVNVYFDTGTGPKRVHAVPFQLRHQVIGAAPRMVVTSRLTEYRRRRGRRLDMGMCTGV